NAQREPGNERLLDGAATRRGNRKRRPPQWNAPGQRAIGTAGTEGPSQGVLLSRGEYAMSTWSLRAAMVPITRRVRAYFAPVDRETEAPAIFDPGKHGAFQLDAPPAPWLDLGWVDHFQRSCGTATETLRASTRGTAAAQFLGP